MVFRFKHFQILDDKCAMKVGVDAVLLGAWADISGVKSILDIGTGSGIISLMLAQRSEALIHAVEIDKDASEQAGENAGRSPWPDRINIDTISVQEYVLTCEHRFDLIVSNPPYFSNSLLSPVSARNKARHNGELSLKDLADAFAKLTNIDGKCCVILPVIESRTFEIIMEEKRFAPTRKLLIYPKSGKPANRALIQFERVKGKQVKEESLFIRNNEDTYSDAYKKLTGDFYLAF